MGIIKELQEKIKELEDRIKNLEENRDIIIMIEPYQPYQPSVYWGDGYSTNTTDTTYTTTGYLTINAYWNPTDPNENQDEP